MGLHGNEILREEWKQFTQQRTKFVVLKCANPICNREIKIPPNRLDNPKFTGLCRPCSQGSLGPFNMPYQRLVRNAGQRGLPITIQYTDYVEFTKTPSCFYCGIAIPWNPERQLSYFLDRKDGERGYDKDNVVVCCSTCNYIRGAHLSFEEMLILVPSLRLLAQHRGVHKTKSVSRKKKPPSQESRLKMSKAQRERQERYRQQRANW